MRYKFVVAVVYVSRFVFRYRTVCFLPSVTKPGQLIVNCFFMKMH